jgi:head-tail adaptor
MDFPYAEEVGVLSPGSTTDPYSGDAADDWSTTTEVTEYAAVEPRPSTEPVQDARNAVTSGFTLYLPADSTVTARKKVGVRGKVYDVLGEPSLWRSPFTGWEPGVVVQCEQTEG